MRKNRATDGRPKGNEAAPDEMGDDPRQVGGESAGQSGDTQRLSSLEDADSESVGQLAEDDQGIEAAAVEGVEDAANHPERPAHTHEEYGRPDDLPPARSSFALPFTLPAATLPAAKPLALACVSRAPSSCEGRLARF